MIISRTPLRISFCGGGTDLPFFYRKHGGAVVSMSIARYVFLSMHKYFFGDSYLLKYSKTERVGSVDQIDHRIIRQVFKDYNIAGVDFNSSADVPAGTGLGSSSAFTVGLLNLCNAYLGIYEDRSRLAAKACEVELEKLGEPIGKQDQYGCALGGLNYIEFHEDDSVSHAVLPMSVEMRARLEGGLVLIYLGGSRSASEVLQEQAATADKNAQAIADMRAMADMARQLRGEIIGNVDVLGDYLHEGWERKRRLSAGITNPAIDAAYARARAAGARGGKLLGAGGAGFLLAYAPGEARDSVVDAFPDCNWFPIRADMVGTTIVYSD